LPGPQCRQERTFIYPANLPTITRKATIFHGYSSCKVGMRFVARVSAACGWQRDLILADAGRLVRDLPVPLQMATPDGIAPNYANTEPRGQ